MKFFAFFYFSVKTNNSLIISEILYTQLHIYDLIVKAVMHLA